MISKNSKKKKFYLRYFFFKIRVKQKNGLLHNGLPK